MNECGIDTGYEKLQKKTVINISKYFPATITPFTNKTIQLYVMYILLEFTMLTSFTKDFLAIENYFHLYNYYFF